MNLNRIHRIITPIVCALLIAETTYLIISYKRGQKSGSAEAAQVAGSKISAGDDLAKGLTHGLQKGDLQLGQHGLSNAVAEIANLSGNGLGSVSNAPQRTARQIRIDNILTKIDELLADDNELKAVELARSIMADPDPEIRSEAVGVFAWAGVKGLPELSKMLADSDPDVATEASEAWESALDELSDDAAKAQVLAAGIKTMTDEDNAESAIMIFDSMEANIAIPAIVDIIQFGTPVAAGVAKGHYEFFTSEPYTTREDADKWVIKEMAENGGPDLPEQQDLPEQVIIKEQ